MEIPHGLLKLPESTLGGSTRGEPGYPHRLEIQHFWMMSKSIFHDFPWFSMIFPFNYGYFFWGDFPMKIHFPMVFPMSTRKSPWSPSCRMIVARWRRVETKFRNAFWHSVTWSPKKQGFTARKHGKLRISSPKIWRWGYNGLWMGLGIIYVYRYLYNSKWI